MSDLFGERPTTFALDSLGEQYGLKANAGELRHHANSGAIALGASGIVAAAMSAAPSYATPKTTFFGSE